jgi:hypothetical protein
MCIRCAQVTAAAAHVQELKQNQGEKKLSPTYQEVMGYSRARVTGTIPPPGLMQGSEDEISFQGLG